MKNWSAGYEILRTYVRFAFRLSHKRVVITGKQYIPKGKPIIFAPNHQNALMDPLALACTNPHQSVWLARADIFKSKVTQPILSFLKILPIYRIRDGKENLSNNEFIFEQVIQLLENKKTVALFPEAAHSGKRQMLSHKKAIPRIALEAEAKNNFNLDLKIVPVGIFYSHYWDFNRSIIVQYGKPISIDGYKAEYTESPQKAMLSLRDEIHEKIALLTLQINSEKYYREYENIRALAGEAYSKNRFFSKSRMLQLFFAEKELIRKIEQMEISENESFKKIIEKSGEYFIATEKSGVSDEQIKLAGQAQKIRLFIQWIETIISFPVFVFGFIFNAIPLFVPRMIFRKILKDYTFLSTFNFASGLIIFPMFYLLSSLLIFWLTNSMLITLITFIMMPFGGKIAFQLLVFYRHNLQKSASIFGKITNRNNMKALLKQREEVTEFILEKVNF